VKCALSARARLMQSFSRRATNTRTAILLAASVAPTACAHRCPRQGPAETSWAQELACSERVELDDRPPVDRVCYRLALGSTYLPNASKGTDRVFMENPGFIELTSEWHSTETRSGYLVRARPQGPWPETGVWWPTREGGAFVDLGTGFSGMLLRLHRNGPGYAGTIATYQDVGDESQRSSARLWPTDCAKMPVMPAG
jgi:hypothetical protein